MTIKELIEKISPNRILSSSLFLYCKQYRKKVNGFYLKKIDDFVKLASMQDRLSRMRLMVGDKALQKLRKAHVMVVGCGAVGSYAIEALARAGVGHLTLVDFDQVSVTNINRQLFALSSTVGKKKVDVAKSRVQDISKDIKIDTLDLLVNAETLPNLLKIKPDFVVDAIDSLNPKCCLIEALVNVQIPFVSSMGAALKTDPTKIQVARMKKTINCPLAFFVRKRLRKRGVLMDFPVVYSPELTQDKSKLQLPEEANQESGRVRHEMGSFPTITGIFGLMCAHVVIQSLTKEGQDG